MGISLPYAVALVVIKWFDPKEKLKALKKFCYSPTTIYLFVILLFLWWVIRILFKI